MGSKLVMKAILISSVLTVINIDFTSVNIVLLQLSNFFHVSITKTQFVISAYTAMWAVFLLIGGKLGDSLGYKSIFFVGLGLFFLGTICCAFSASINQLITYRAIQGIGSGLMYPNAMSLVFLDMPLEKKGMGMGIFSSMSAFGLVCGPIFAGLVLGKFGWQGIFYFSAIFIMPAIFYSVFNFRVEKAKSKFRLSQLYADVIFSISFLTIIFVLGSQHCSTVFKGGVFLVAAIAFFIMAKFKKNFQAVYSSKFQLCCLTRGVIQFNFASAFFLLSLFFQSVLGYSPIKTGIMLLPLTLVFGVLSPFSGLAIDKFGAIFSLKLGLYFLIFSEAVLFCLNIFSLGDRYFLYLIALSLFGFGMALSYSSVNTQALKEVKNSIISKASAIFTFSTLIGVILGVIFSSFMIKISEGMFISMVDIALLLASVLLITKQFNLRGRVCEKM